MRRYVVYVVASVAVVVIALVATIFVGNEPVLGLDLQGGISVRLFPAGNPSSSSLDTAKDIIDRRVNGLGVSDAEVAREGDNIVINLPGVKDRDKAKRLVGRTAELRFRPVFAELPSEAKQAPPANDAAKAAIAGCDPAALQQAAPALSGKDASGAKSRFSQGQGYAVELNLKGSGSDKINALAREAFSKPPPQNQMAIVLDGVVQSAPRFQTADFGSGPVEITGSFTQGEASDLASILQYGALPVKFDEKQQTVESVSPTLGSDQLRSGIAAGLVGLALVALYMLLYYRLLGVVVILGLGLSAGATYALVASLSLASGSVKGFAFFLGLSTVLDLAVAYFFMHPLVVLLAQRRPLVRVPVVGIASGLDAKEAPA